jgi:membrane-associated phospholipid phosphatase
MYALLVSYDRPLNTFPSLHVGLSAYTVLFGARAWRGRMAPFPRRVLFGALALWVCAIGYAAVAIGQHFAIDLPAGVLLAWACHRLAWKAP